MESNYELEAANMSNVKESRLGVNSAPIKNSKTQSEGKGGVDVISLFSGCGGMDLGFQKAGFNIKWANDIEKRACETVVKIVQG